MAKNSNKTERTNQLTKVFFSQYGVNKVLQFNGNVKQAKEYLKRNMGIKRTYYSTTEEGSSFLPVGYCSTETVLFQ